MIEKLEASTADVKIEALTALERSVKVWGKSVAVQYTTEIWNTLTKETLVSSDAPVVSASLALIKTIWSVVMPDRVRGFRFHPPLRGTAHSAVDTQWIGPVLSECLGQLKQPDSKMARLYVGRVLSVSTAASENSCERIWHEMWPAIKQRLASQHLQPSQRLALLELVGSAVETGVAAFPPTSLDAKESAPHPLRSYVDELIRLYTAAVTSDV